MADKPQESLASDMQAEVMALTTLSAAEFLALTEDFIVGRPAFPVGYPSSCLAELADIKLRVGEVNDLVWGRSTVLLYEQVVQEEPQFSYSALWHAMLRRTELILHHGNKAGDYLLDIENIVRAFHDELSMTLEQAYAIVKDNTRSKGPEGAKLRYIFDLLGFLIKFKDAGLWVPNDQEELDTWLEVKAAYWRV